MELKIQIHDFEEPNRNGRCCKCEATPVVQEFSFMLYENGTGNGNSFPVCEKHRIAKATVSRMEHNITELI